jgi:hypothetical protein
MVVIKLTTPWQQDYISQTPSGKAVFDNYRFEINNDCAECDCWLIWGGLSHPETVNVYPENVIYITDEAHDQRVFTEEFLQQFINIASVRKDVVAKNLYPIHEFAPWYFNKSYDFLSVLEPPIKTKNISVISSNLTWLPGHKKRFDFVNGLIAHFKDKVDVYGRGFNEIPDKYDALIDYKYSVAIENNCMPGYFTEKISECFLAYTMPVYYGCPDIHNYYDCKSMINIDINDYQGAFKKIEELIETDPYHQYLPFVEGSRQKFLHTYHMFPAMIELVKNMNKTEKRRKPTDYVRFFPENDFIKNSSKSARNNVLLSGGIKFKNILGKFKNYYLHI